MGRGIGYGRGKWSEIMVYYFIFGGGEAIGERNRFVSSLFRGGEGRKQALFA